MKKWIRISLIVIIALIVVFAGAKFYVRSRINSLLQKKVTKGELTYSDLRINLFTGDLSVDSVVYKSVGKAIKIGHLSLEGLHYFTYLDAHKIELNSISIDNPRIRIFKSSKRKDTIKNDKPLAFPQISIESIKISHGGFRIKKDTVLKFGLEDFTLRLKALKINKKIKNEPVSFSYGDLRLKGEGLRVDLGTLQKLAIARFEADSARAVLHQIDIIPKYSRQDYVDVIPYEKDLMDIQIGKMKLENYKIDFDAPSGGLSASKILLDSIDATIYRDKTIANDPTKKKMYSGKLRQMKFKVSIDTFQLKHTAITYLEVQKSTGETGKVFFKDMSLLAGPITNMNMGRTDFPETKIAISCLFMGTSPLTVNWKFNIGKASKTFRIQGAGHHIPPEAINLFFVPAFNMKAKGDGIKGLYFDFHGNERVAQGHFKMNYDKLKIAILKKDSKEKKGILSFVANLFVNHKNLPKIEEVKVTNVKRNPTKSFWNYFWQCIFAGLKKTILK